MDASGIEGRKIRNGTGKYPRRTGRMQQDFTYPDRLAGGQAQGGGLIGTGRLVGFVEHLNPKISLAGGHQAAGQRTGVAEPVAQDAVAYLGVGQYGVPLGNTHGIFYRCRMS